MCFNRLIQGLTEVKRLFKTLMLTLPAVFNILTLLLLLFFIFTIVGIQLFATVAIHDDVTQHTNLRYFSRSFIVLLRFSTGENWNGFMHSIASDVDNCVRNPVYDERFCGFNDEFDCLPLEGCGNSAIYIYMILFNVIVAFVFVNLFIGVILEVHARVPAWLGVWVCGKVRVLTVCCTWSCVWCHNNTGI